jgi:hypothetical protein
VKTASGDAFAIEFIMEENSWHLVADDIYPEVLDWECVH